MENRNRWRNMLVGDSEKGEGTLERKIALCFLCSLINTAFMSSAWSSILSPTTSPSPSLSTRFDLSTIKSTFENAIEVANIAQEKLTSAVVGGGVRREGSTKSLLINQCLQLVSILLIDHGSSFGVGTTTDNIFITSISKLHRPSDLSFLLTGFTTLIAPLLAQSFLTDVASLGTSLSSGSASNGERIGSEQEAILETIVLLARLVEVNKKFVRGLVAVGKLGELMEHLMGIILVWKDDASRFGLIRVIVFLIQSITADPSFVSNESIELRYTKNEIVGSLGDYLIVSPLTVVASNLSRD